MMDDSELLERVTKAILDRARNHGDDSAGDYGDAERMAKAAIATVEASRMSDGDLSAAYQRTTGEHGDPVADALCAEIERRGLDV